MFYYIKKSRVFNEVWIFKNELNLKTKDEITNVWKDIEPAFSKSLMETINQHEGENEKVNDKVNLLETENKILKNDIANKQKNWFFIAA